MTEETQNVTPDAGLAKEPCRPPRWRRWSWRLLKTIFFLLLFVGVLLYGALLYLRSEGGRETLRDQILTRTKKIIPGLRIGRIEGNYTSHLGLRDLVLNDRFGGPAIALEQFEARYDLSKLARQRVQIDEVRLVAPHIVFRPTKGGKSNFEELIAPQPPEPEKPQKERGPLAWTIRVGKLRIEKGRFEAPAIGERGLRITDFELELGATVADKRVKAALRHLRANVALPDGRRVRLSLGGQAALEGEEIDAQLQLQAQDASSREPIALKLKAKGNRQALALRLDGTLPGQGALTLKGLVGQRGKSPHGKLDLQLMHIVPAAIVPGLGLPPAELGLKLKGTLRGTPLQEGSEAALELELAPGTRVMGYRIAGLSLRAKAHGKTFSLERLRARAYGATLVASARGTQERIERATLHLDVPAVERLPLPGVKGAGRATLSASASGPLSALRANVELKGEALRLPGIAIGKVDLRAKASGLPDLARARAKVDLSAADIDSGDPGTRVDHLVLNLDGGLKHLDLALEARGPKLAAELALKSRQNTSFSRIDVMLEKLKAAALGYRIALRQPTRLAIRPGREITLEKTRLALLDGMLTIEGRFRPRSFPRVEARLALQGIRPPQGPRVSGRLEARLDRRDLTARLALALPAGGSIALDGKLPLRYRGGTPQPAWKQPLQLKLSAKALDLAALSERALARGRVGGKVALALEADGQLADPRVQGDISWRGARFDEVAPLDGRLTIDARPKTSLATTLSLSRRQKLLELRAKLASGLAPLIDGRAKRWLEGQGPNVEVDLDLPSTTLASLGRLHPALAQAVGERKGKLAAKIAVRGSPQAPRVELLLRADDLVLQNEAKSTSLALKLGAKTEAQSVESNAQLTLFDRPLLDLRATLGRPLRALLSPGGVLAAPLAAEIQVRETDLRALTGLVPALKQAAGKLSARISASGTARRPRADLSLAVRGVRFEKVEAGDLELEGLYDAIGTQPKATAKLELTQPTAEGGRRGSLRGDVSVILSPRDFAKSQLEARLRGNGLDLAFLRHLTPALEESGGKLDLALEAKGGLLHPQLVGRVQLSEGLLRPRGMTALKQIDARLTVAPGKARLERLTLRSARGGGLRVTGHVDLDRTLAPRRFFFHTVADDLKLDAPGMQNLKLSADVKSEGAFEAGALRSRITLRRGELWLPKLSGGRDLLATSASIPDVRFVDGAKKKKKDVPASTTVAQPKKGKRKKKRPSMRLVLDADPLFVRSEEIDIEVAAKLTVRIDERGRPLVGGHLAIRRGTVRILGNAYRVERARLQFSERVPPDPALDVLLSREMAGVTVFIGVRGMATNPELVLRSDPPQYDRAQLMSLVLTGRIDPRKGGEGGDQSGALAAAAANAVVGGMLSSMIPKMGLIDTARLGFGQTKDEATGEEKLRVEAEAGKYITKRLYLAIRRVLTGEDPGEDNLTEALLEYRISARWLLVALFGDAGVGALDVMWTYRY